MGKLLSLKEWLTIPDTAKHPSTIIGEEVTEADVLRLGLDEKLLLSINFVNHTHARRGKIVRMTEQELKAEVEAGHLPENLQWITSPSLRDPDGPPTTMLVSLRIDDDRLLNLDDTVNSIEGIWDLPMVGGEQLDIEHKYQMLTQGPAITLVTLDGCFVQRSEDEMWQLQTSFDENEFQSGSTAQLKTIERTIAEKNLSPQEAEKLLNKHSEDREAYSKKRKEKRNNDFYPGELPHDNVLVVRVKSLLQFEKSIAEGKNHGTRSEKTLVPKRLAIDDDVIDYWKKKNSANRDEIAALVCGMNPYGMKDVFDSAFESARKEDLSEAKKCEIADVLRVLKDRLNSDEYYLSLGKWKAILEKHEIPLPQWLSLIEGEQEPKVADLPISASRPLTTKEQTTLLTMVALLADHAKVDWRRPSKAAEMIVTLATQSKLSIGQRTIEEYLKKIPDALGRKAKHSK